MASERPPPLKINILNKPSENCKVYISCNNARKLKNKLEKFKYNQNWYGIQKLIRLKRYLTFIENFLLSILNKEFYQTGIENTILSKLFIKPEDFIKFWLRNIQYLITICGFTPLKI